MTSVTSRNSCRIVVFFSWKPKTRFADVTRLNSLPSPLWIAAIIQILPLLSLNGPTTLPVRFNLKIHVLGFMQNWLPSENMVCTSSVVVDS